MRYLDTYMMQDTKALNMLFNYYRWQPDWAFTVRVLADVHEVEYKILYLDRGWINRKMEVVFEGTWENLNDLWSRTRHLDRETHNLHSVLQLS